MIEYKVSFDNPLTHIIDIEVLIDNIEEDFILFNLPAWRPGRYELANYAKNILVFKAYTLDDQLLNSYKISKDIWKVEMKNKKALKVNYKYYAFTMDAGNSWLDDVQLYINPINCFVYNQDRLKEKCTLLLNIPAYYKIGTGLKEIGISKFVAKDYYELADCPIIASPTLKRLEYSVGDVEFNIWIQGRDYFETEKVIQDFLMMSKCQIEMMGEFPEKEYHFLFQLLPYSFRHGVEHRNSTVITIGPDYQVKDKLYNDFLGIASHELFHAWNVLKIRPKELMPYDFSKEIYFKTGYVAEGITTYYGDLLLVRSKLYLPDQYFIEFTDLLQRHFDNTGNYNLSLADSSFDLWLDGYVPGVPGRKVSIYVKGAVVAFILDIEIRKQTQNKYSLDDIMRNLWEKFGKPGKGYSEDDLAKIIKRKTGIELKKLIEKCVYDSTDLKEEVDSAFAYLGLQLTTSYRPDLECMAGVKTLNIGGKFLVDQIHPNSPAILLLSKNDEILSVDDCKYEGGIIETKNQLSITINRGGRILTEKISLKKNKLYFGKSVVSLKQSPSQNQKDNLNLWLNQTTGSDQ